MIRLNVKQLAIANGVDDISAFDKDVFVESAISNAGLAPSLITDEAVTIESGLVVGYTATLHFSDGSTAPLVYTTTNYGDSAHQYHKVAVGGENPFYVEKFAKNDTVRPVHTQAPTPTPTAPILTPTPTPVAVGDYNYMALSHLSSENTVTVQRFNTNTGRDETFGVKTVTNPTGLEIKPILDGWRAAFSDSKLYLRAFETATPASQHLVGYDISETDGLINHRDVVVGSYTGGITVGMYGDVIITAGRDDGTNNLNISAFSDSGTAITQLGTSYVPEAGVTNISPFAPQTGVRSSPIGTLDGDLVVVVFDGTNNIYKLKSFTLVGGTQLTETAFNLDIADVDFSPNKVYFVDGRLMLVTGTGDYRIYDYDSTLGFSLAFTLNAASFTLPNVEISSVDTRSTPNRIHGVADGGNSIYVWHLDFNTEAPVVDYTAVIDWNVTGLPTMPDSDVFANVALGTVYANDWNDSLDALLYFTGSNYQTTWQNSTPMVDYYSYQFIHVSENV